MKETLEKYLREILEIKEILGVSFHLKNGKDTLLKLTYGTPTTNSTIGLVDLAFEHKESKYLSQDMLYNSHEYVNVTEQSSFVLSYIATKKTISDIELNHMSEYIKLVIKDFYIVKQKNKITSDLYRLWDIIDSTMNHYINNQLFTMRGKCDIIKASGDLSKVDDIKCGIDSLIDNTNKIFSQKDIVLSDKGIVESKMYYKNNSIIAIE